MLEDAVDDLFLRTHKRCYLGVVRGGVIEITVVRGRQGIARMPGLGTQITDNAHALAMGKVVLARLRPAALGALRRRAACTRYTPSTITDARELSPRAAARARRRLRGRPRGVRRRTSAASRRRCSTSAARLAAILGLSASTRAFDAEHAELAAGARSRDVDATSAGWRHERSNIVRKSTCFLPPGRAGSLPDPRHPAALSASRRARSP